MKIRYLSKTERALLRFYAGDDEALAHVAYGLIPSRLVRLLADGLVLVSPGGPITLTTKGQEVLAEIIRSNA